MDKMYKFVKYLHKEGPVATFHRTKRYVKKKIHTSKKTIDVMVAPSDVVIADFINNPYKRPSAITKKRLSIAWVLSPLSEGSGGQNTIVRFAKYLKSQGHEVTFYIYESIQPQTIAQAKKILRKHFSFDVNVRKIRNYEKSDVVIATGWETAYPVFNLKSKAHKFYFIQDFEPLFYGMGSKAILAENTYKMNFYGITAGKWLEHKVKTEYGMSADHFDFGADLHIYKHDSAVTKKQKKVVFYARPVTERRAFELGVMALDIFHKKHPDYEIHFIGWDTSEYKLPFPYKNRGILSHTDLATLYAESEAGLVLSLTNVSLLPLELLAAGCIPVLNEGDNNAMVLGKNDYIHYSSATPFSLADELSKIVSMKDIQKYSEEASDSVSDLSWEKSYAKVEKIIMKEVSR